ncbi:MAG: hypothetical protein RJA70_4107 [Pseudomonadota bacterium]
MTSYKIRHTTRYDYEVPVLHAQHLAHLRPRVLPFQRVGSSEVRVAPVARGALRSSDYFGNDCDTIELLEPHDALEVTALSRVTLAPRGVDLTQAVTPWEDCVALLRQGPQHFAVIEYAVDSPLVRAHTMFRSYSQGVFAPRRPLGEVIAELNHRIFTDFKYEPSATDISTPLAQVMRERSGVCQDFAHVAIACLRSFGIPARYVSGYLETVPPPGQVRLVGADASHAWAAAYIPELGFVDFDPTNDLLPDQRHITVAWGRDFSDVSPLKGVVLGGGGQRLTVGVDVEPLTDSSSALS